MHLVDGISLVASGELGFQLTSPYDSNVFSIDTADGIVLVDAGSGVESNTMAQRLLAGGDPVAAILLTHGHWDHAGGASRIAQITGATVYASADLVEPLGRGDDHAIDLVAARAAGLYPADARLDTTPAKPLADGDVLTFGRHRFLVIATPGHSLGSVSFLLDVEDRRHLFTGDAVFGGGRIVLQDIPSVDVRALARSIRQLGDLQFDGFFPGHGVMTVSRGPLELRPALDRLNQLLMPASLI